MTNVVEQQNEGIAYLNKRSDDDIAYGEFAREMASRIALNNKSESVDVLIDTLEKSEYYKGL